MQNFFTFYLLTFCFGLSYSSILPPFARTWVNSLRQLGCDVDLQFQTEGVNVKILCDLEDIMTWLDSWFRPILIATIAIAISCGILVILCCVKVSKLNFGCSCISSKCCNRTHQEVYEKLDDSKTIPLLLQEKDCLKQNT
ncbi:unnamed protein product [Orchesella dallaii]|uniref:Uncharacterized protein n=1 Tax=Orchesella dallaii TaxID=48710 RepID=A0ABP1RBA7_9HEXA